MSELTLFDTHAHLDFDALGADLEATLARAAEAGIRRVITIGASRGWDSNERALAIARRDPDRLRCTIGVHPHDADLMDEAIERKLRALMSDERVVGVGESGLDFHYDRSDRGAQEDSFRRHLAIAREANKPIVIHTREAEERTLAILDEQDHRGGVIHCFTGSPPFCDELLARDFVISFSGIVTFKSGRGILEIAARLPADRILIETDAPYLAPVPHRGRSNEPAYLAHTARAIAQARGEALADFARQTYRNACRVFGWPDAA